VGLARLAAGGAALLVLVLPARASAATIDVYATQSGTNIGNTAPPCPVTDPCDLRHAIQSANANSGGGTVHVLGALEWNSDLPTIGASGNPVDLVGTGSGPGGTFINVSQPVALTLAYGSTVEAVHVKNVGGVGVGVFYGSQLKGSVIETASSPGSVAVGIQDGSGALTTQPARLQNIAATATGDVQALTDKGTGSTTGESLEVSDSTFRGGAGATLGSAPTVTVERSTIESTNGSALELSTAGDAHVSSSVIRVGGGSDASGVLVGPGATQAYLIEDTIDGAGAPGAVRGVETFRGNTAFVTDTIVRGFGIDLYAHGPTEVGQSRGKIVAGHSDFSTAVGEFFGYPPAGVVDTTTVGDNHDLDPRYVDRAHGDYRLRFDSPLIDLGGSAPIDTAHAESSTDRAGHARIVDGNNNGTAERDIGAFEYIFARPTASFTHTPQSTVTGQRVSFDASASSYSTGPIVDYAWDLDGNGTFETHTGSSPHASRVYLVPGTVAVRLRVTGFDGAPDQTQQNVVVVSPKLTNLSVSPRNFSLAGRKVSGRCVKRTKQNAAHPHCRRPIALRVSYNLNGASTVTFTLKRVVPGRKVNGACVKPTAKNATHPRCTRLLSVHGRIVRASTAGPNHFTFNGKIGGRTIGPGTYKLTATPAGGTPHKVTFAIVP
jgi:hypothetical protein